MLQPGALLASWSGLAFQRPRRYLRGFYQKSDLLLVRDLLRGRMGSCHGRTYSDWIS